MRIAILGLGYVGCVSAACLARDGHHVVGVDVNEQKLDLLARGISPIVEPGLDDLIKSAAVAGRLRVTHSHAEAVRGSDLSLICVGTPSKANGSLSLDYVERACDEVGRSLAKIPRYHVVAVRSTVLPGTVEDRVLPILERASRKTAGRDFGLCMHPEFLREGSAVNDYVHQGYVVIGELDRRSGNRVRALYRASDAPVIRTSLRTAEMVKYAGNAFHALKVVFANEIGNVCKAHGIDGQRVMEILCQDRQLNVSPAYLMPGFAFGGSCLPKDVRALVYRAKERDVECPALSAVLPSNRRQIELGIRLIEDTGRKKIGVLGLSFKAGTDDVRESPVVALVETLVGRGYQVQVFDDSLELSRLMGANKRFLESELPHIASLMCGSVDQLVSGSEVVVITNGGKAFRRAPRLLSKGQILIDLVGTGKNHEGGQGTYEGICW